MKRSAMVLAAILGAAGLAALGAERAAAKGGGGGSNPPPQVDSGLIYYQNTDTNAWYTMKPDGSSKTAFTAVSDTSSSRGGTFGKGTPSTALHGNARWWLQWKEVDSHSMSGNYEVTAGGTTYTLPDFPRVELYATSESTGTSYRLTDCATFETIDSTDWLVELIEPDMGWKSVSGGYEVEFPGSWPVEAWGNDGTVKDGKASFGGRRWTRQVVYSGGSIVRDGNGNPTFTTWLLAEMGHWAVQVDPEAFSSHDPAAPYLAVSTPIWSTSKPYWVSSFATWSTDGARLAFSAVESGGNGISVCNDGGSSLARIASGRYPRWSPVDSRILLFTATGDIALVNADGTGYSVLVADPAEKGKGSLLSEVWPASWSPSGTWALYYQLQVGSSTSKDTCRIPAAGGNPVLVSSDAFPKFWR